MAQGFHGMYTPDGIDVIAVGDNGEVYRSFDQGSNWIDRVLGSGEALHDVAGSGFKIVVVADGGEIWLSTDNGGNWSKTVLPGSQNLLSVAMPSSQTWFVAGAAGTIARTTNAGGSWTPLTSGTGASINAIRFTDTLHGWAACDGGVLLRTSNGGDSWTPVALGTVRDLMSVDERATTVWVVGKEGVAFRSTNDGGSFSPVNLKLDAHADVQVVRMQSPDTLWIAGGGGFIRYSIDGGTTWTYQVHRMHAPISDFVQFDSRVWACSSKNRVIMYSLDRGGFWRFPNAASFTRTWVQKYTGFGQTRGNSFAINPVYKSTLYDTFANLILRSRDDGESWSVADTMPAIYTRTNAFLVSPKDTNSWLVAVQQNIGQDVILKTTDAGVHWTMALNHDFGEYGTPLEMDPDHPDTVYFAGENAATGSPATAFFRSYDFGATWDSVAAGTFRSPCDVVAVPDSSNIIVVGDGVTGSGTPQFLKSTDRGLTFPELIPLATGSEIPAMACSRLRPSTLFGTNWSSGGVRRSQNYGSTWTQVDLSAQAWGIDIARDDPNVLVFGIFTPAGSSISVDGGASFTALTAPANFGNNYSFLLRDRATILAQQSSGIWKLATNYTHTPGNGAQAVVVSSPNGGEVWSPNTTHTIQWSATNLGLARVEYRRSPSDPWVFIADVAGYLNSCLWTVPYAGSNQMKVRVRDAWDFSPEDSSNAVFTVPGPYLQASPGAIAFGTVPTPSSQVKVVTVKNDGTQTLNVTSMSLGTPAYALGKSSLVLAAGASDTVGVLFAPVAVGSYPDTITLVSDDPGHSPLKLPVSGTAAVPGVRVIAPNGGESWAWNSIQNITWSSTFVSTVGLDYRVSPDSTWKSITEGLPAAQASYAWTIPLDMTTQAQVRARGDGGTSDVSDAAFSLTAPLFATLPADTLRLPDAPPSSVVSSVIQVNNPGTAALVVSSVTVGDPEFWVGRSSLTVPPAGSDTIGVYYAPSEVGSDTTAVAFSANDPGASHSVIAVARGIPPLAVADDAPVVALALEQNRPNPFAGATTIRYALPRETEVSLEVFDLHGQRVATLARGAQPAGRHTARFGLGTPSATGRTAALPSGVYFYRLRAGGITLTRKMLLTN
jgi:photosystem II stability/assembly factor-like uncharacterized protein